MNLLGTDAVFDGKRRLRVRLEVVAALVAAVVISGATSAQAERCLSKSLYAMNTVVGANAFARVESATPASPFFAYGAANCTGSTVWMGGSPKPSA